MTVRVVGAMMAGGQGLGVEKATQGEGRTRSVQSGRIYTFQARFRGDIGPSEVVGGCAPEGDDLDTLRRESRCKDWKLSRSSGHFQATPSGTLKCLARARATTRGLLAKRPQGILAFGKTARASRPFKCPLA